VLLVVF